MPAPATEPSLLSGPVFERAFEAEQARIAALLAVRQSAAGARELAASQTAYADQSASQAVETISRAHPEFVTEPAWNSLSLPGRPAVQAKSYPSPTTARVAVPGATSDALVESTVPLRAHTEGGALAPVDHSLVATDHGFQPANPLADLELPQRADGALSMNDIGLEVSAPGATPIAGEPVADSVVYPNAAGPDADLLAKPVPGGMELAWTLRSAASPERYALSFELPEGTTLAAAPLHAQGAVIQRAGEVVAHIPPPVATDADGLAVELSWRVLGDRLQIELPHRAEAHAYPLLLDPVIIEDGALYDDTSFANGFAGWLADQNDPDFDTGSGQTGIGWGLEMGGSAGRHYGYLAKVSWAQNAPGTRSSIFYASFANVTALGAYQASGVPYSWVMEGLYSAAGWEQGSSNAPNAGGHSPYVTGGTITPARTAAHCFSLPGCTGTVHENNTMALVTFTNPGGYAPASFWTFIGGAATWTADAERPSVRDAEHFVDGAPIAGRPAGWYDGETLAVATEARDLGLGVKSFELNVPGLPTQTVARPCTGAAGSRCASPDFVRSHPAGQGFTYSTAARPAGQPQMPQGLDTVNARGTDVVANTSPAASWRVGVDRSAPEVHAPSGSLHASRGDIHGENAYALDITATDGSAASDAQRRSGVKRIEVWVDEDSDDPIYSAERPDADCDLVGGGCPMTMRRTWHVDPYEIGEGSHTIKIVAIDKLGHASPEAAQQFTVDVTTDIALGALTLSATDPAPDGSYALTAQALEAHDTPGRPVSGMSYMELLVDGESVESFEPGCPAGNCDLTHTFQMSGSQSLADHQISVIVYDRAGNGTTKHMGKTQDFYERFGYSDQFSAKDLRAADRGGANILRVGIDWCAIAQNPANPAARLPRASWDWGESAGPGDPPRGVAKLFGDIRDRNTNNPEDLRVIAVLLNSPSWARANTNTPCSVIAPPADGFIRGPDSDWRYFVKEFTTRFGPNPRPGEPDYTGARLEAVELWNEPNLEKFWGENFSQFRVGAPQTFADLVNVGSSAVKSVAGTLRVLPGGMSPIKDGPGKTFMRQRLFMKRASQDVARPIAPSRIDGISIHLYADGAFSERGAMRNINDRYRTLLDALGTTPLAHRARWITEIGFPSNPQAVSGQTLRTQRERLRQAYIAFARKPNLRAFVVHRLVDRADGNRQYGVLDEDPENNCKQIYRRLAELRKSLGRIQCPPT